MNQANPLAPGQAAPAGESVPEVVSGAIIAYRLFEIAYAIDLSQVEQLWARQVGKSSARKRLIATPPKAVAFGVPPVVLTLDPVLLDLDGATPSAGVTSRLYDFGVVSIAVRLPAERMPWPDFVDLANAVAHAIGPGSAVRLWTTLLDQIRAPLIAAFERPFDTALEEDYLIGVVETFDRRLDAVTLMERIDLVPLLSGEQRPLSAGARQDLLRQRFSYYPDDLVVLTWDRAFIYEPRADSDVIGVLEVANAQLLEMRYYDELLDAELPRMYDLVERTRRGRWVFGSRRYADLARRLYTLVAEVTELTEKVYNTLQVTEDVYLARIYSAALDLFRVPTAAPPLTASSRLSATPTRRFTTRHPVAGPS
jgi:hypothetical protein